MKLHEYQDTFIKALYAKFKTNNTVAGIAPTGAGKTVMMAQICADGVKHNRRILILVDRKCLIPQTVDKLSKFGLGIFCGYIKAGYPEDRNALIQVASIQTLQNREWWKQYKFNLVIFDESHITMWSKVGSDVLEHQKLTNGKVIGFTATPYRLKKTECFLDKVETWVSTPVPSVLQEMGFLVPTEYYTYKVADLQGVRMSGGDYRESDLEIAVNKNELIEHAYKEWYRLAKNRPTLAFCVSVKHAQAGSDFVNAKGYTSAHAHTHTRTHTHTHTHTHTG